MDESNVEPHFELHPKIRIRTRILWWLNLNSNLNHVTESGPKPLQAT